MWLPVERTWQLNERHYGAAGSNKAQTVEKARRRPGEDLAGRWRTHLGERQRQPAGGPAPRPLRSSVDPVVGAGSRTRG